MINLIKNELFKIFKKKGIYIILFVLLIYTIFINYIAKESNKDYQKDYIKILKDEIKDYDVNNLSDEELTIYIDDLNQIETYELKTKYDKSSWQYYIISEEGYNYISKINNNKYRYKDKTKEEKYYKEYNEFLESLKGDWKDYANKKLNRIDNNDEKKEIELRLKYNIAYGDNKLNEALRNYIYTKLDSFTPKTFEDKITYQNIEKNYYINKYMVENNFNEPNDDTTRGMLLNLLSSTELFIIIASVLIAGTIISEEFNKGTIKLLLVRPYSRTKILLSKFISILIITILILISAYLMELIVGGIFFGFNSLNKGVLIYNYSTKTVKEISLFKNIVLTTLCKAPIYILLSSFAFFLTVIGANSGVSMALSLIIYISSPIINNMITYFNISKLKYIVTLNWDLNNFLYGKLFAFENLTLISSLITNIIYFILLIIPTIIIFRKKNIKNI